MKRRELKFQLSPSGMRYVKDFIRFSMARDHHTFANQSYPVFTAYFDTPHLKWYEEKKTGEFSHAKIRLRRYERDLLQPGKAFLEIKTKNNEDQHKNRLVVDLAELGNSMFCPAEWPRSLFSHWNLDVLSYECVHICSVYYDREAFVSSPADGQFRINFDENCAALLPEETKITPDLLQKRKFDLPGGILEIKTGDGVFPHWLNEVLRYVGADRIRFSKYITAVDFLFDSRPFISSKGI